MTDLRKGIVNINGLDISRNTPSTEVFDKLESVCSSYLKTESGVFEVILFENIEISNKKFSVLVHYVMNQLSHITLVSNSNEDATEEERHKEDIEWLNKLLGEPSKRDDFGIVYKYENLKVSADKYTKDNYEIMETCIRITYLREKENNQKESCK